MILQSPQHHPHGISDFDFDQIFTQNRPVILAYHGYPYLIHRLVYKRANHENFHVRGFIEQGTTTTPFDMAVLNKLDRFHLAISAINAVPVSSDIKATITKMLNEKIDQHREYIQIHGEDMPEIKNWKWALPK